MIQPVEKTEDPGIPNIVSNMKRRQPALHSSGACRNILLSSLLCAFVLSLQSLGSCINLLIRDALWVAFSCAFRLWLIRVCEVFPLEHALLRPALDLRFRSSR